MIINAEAEVAVVVIEVARTRRAVVSAELVASIAYYRMSLKVEFETMRFESLDTRIAEFANSRFSIVVVCIFTVVFVAYIKSGSEAVYCGFKS